MTQFRRYEHLERLGHPEVRDIELGRVHVFPKLDGTNASLWRDAAGDIQCGSRNRVLTIDTDNHGFCAWVRSQDAEKLCLAIPEGVWVYGEWLVPHTIKSYRSEAWRRFWIFDVFDAATGRFLPWERYSEMLAGNDLVEPLCIINEPSTSQLLAQVETNRYLVEDGAGVGEGVVLKRYDWQNQFGRQCWAKLVRNEFAERNRREFGVTEKEGAFQIERTIAEEFCTPTLVGKTRAKVVAAVANHHKIDLTKPNAQQLVEASFRGNVIPQLLGRVWNDFVTEELWSAIKKHKNPTIDFGLLHRQVERRVKGLAADLFGGVTAPEPAAVTS
jgi:hypothetical protein